MWSKLVWTLALFAVVAHGFEEWAGTLSAATMHSSFIVWGGAGQQIKVHVDVDDNRQYQLLLYRPGEYFPDSSAYESSLLQGATKWESGLLEVGGFWRVEVLPVKDDEMFQIKVEVDVGGVVGRYVDVARRKKLVVLNYQEGDDCLFTLIDIAPSLVQQIQIEMYEGQGEGLTYQLGDLLTTNKGSESTQYIGDCTAKKSGYHYLMLSASQAAMSLFPRVILNYFGNPFPCPYQPLYLDSNSVYPTCNSSQAVFPCLEYQQGSLACGKCVEGYILQGLECYQDAKCSESQYFDKGECKQVISNCAQFAKVGGKCWNCAAGYKLMTIGQLQFCYFDTSLQTQQLSPQTTVQPTESQPATNSQTSSQSGNPPPVSPVTEPATTPVSTPSTPSQPTINCGPGSYASGNVCVLYPAFCTAFDPSIQSCTRCESQFTVNQFNFSCVPQTVNCPAFTTNINNRCLPFPAFCTQTNAINRCIRCNPLYRPSPATGLCLSIQCAQGLYLTFEGQCKTIDQGCQDFDRQLRICTKCKGGYIQDSNKNCNLVSVFQQTVTVCGPRQYLQSRNSLCRKVDPLCDHFDVFSGECLNCSDPDHLLDESTGKCISTSKLCEQGYYYSAFTQLCEEVSPFCTDYNRSNGFCLNCTGGLTLFKGNCLFLSPCARNQYRNNDGQCIPGPQNCVEVNEYSGICLACNQDYDWNEGGLCCYSLNYLLDEACRPLLRRNCKNFREGSRNCVECEQGYRQYNGILSMCRLA